MNRLVLFCVFSTLWVTSAFAQGAKNTNRKMKRYVLEKRFADCPQPPAPQYNDLNNWAAHPLKTDPSDERPKGVSGSNEPPLADVFFVHPTSYTGNSNDSFLWNADIRNSKINDDTDKGSIRYQASIFNGCYRVYAPRYRQAHYFCFITPNLSDKKQALDLAYTDVKRAFEVYLSQHRNGRPFLIAAHSQGTIHAHRILREFVEGTPLQQDFVGAYLPGMPVPADSFSLIPPCKDSSDFGCWTSWRTWRYGYGISSFPAVCHNPITWTTDTLPAPKSLHKGAVLQDFKKVRPQICDAKVEKTVLWVHHPQFPGSRLIKNPNYHIGDYNLFYMDVRSNASLRLRSFLSKNTSEKTERGTAK